MKIEGLCEYLQVPESWIRSKIKLNAIPFHNSHGILRFNRQEVDDWMKVPSSHRAVQSRSVEMEDEGRNDRMSADGQMVADLYPYRQKPIKEYILTATKILSGRSPWMRLPDFIKKTVNKMKEHDRDYLYRKEFSSFLPNFNDYLRVSCQLGLIDKVGNEEQDERIKRYHPTYYAKQISTEDDIERVRKIIADSVLHIVRTNREAIPDERHAILLLWLFLKINNSGTEPQQYHFKKETDKLKGYFPRIRLSFAESLSHFLFAGDAVKEREFLSKWEQLM